ncbi:TonB-dependent Receptor Plug Domain [Colwellia chukchiensis]|uniref:TonB-dependent Receptor Plug Domain n=1 Tax=Colwellia chukchiensis TaxID=641665 RepID=A0A1H7MQF9_9GAMM|nr:TonB-dependent receptor [Colwellia chukchiensis]SEL12925.1 TonB-dependent Receptor Plug Domain [Colwellia chukchiensis]
MNKQLFRKSAITLAIISASSLGLTSHVQAQAADGLKKVEVISITGSRIKRQSETPSPVQDLDFEALNQTGAMSLGEVLQELPSVGSSLNGNGSSGTSHGSSSLNLRNLGANRSLVLVNGQRWVNGAGTRGFRDFVDMNTIPQAIVNRVEVLQDGATAIYGADAIAGVVNIYTHADYVGSKIKTYYGQSSQGDRETANIDFLWGKDFGDSNLMFAASYTDQKPIYTQDRALTAVPLNGLTAATPEGLFRENDLQAMVGFDVPSAGITRDPGTDGANTDNWRAASGDDKYNRYHNNYVTGPSKRTSLYAQAIVPFDDINLKVEALYNNRKSDQQFSQALSAVRGSRGFMIANDPSVNPFGVEFSGSDFRHSAFFTDNGYRVNAQDVETVRLGIGLDGEINDDWSWDSYLSWAENKGEFTSHNQMHLDKLALALRACNTTGISADVSDLAADCVPVNLFNPLTAQMVDYINFTGHDKNKASQIDFTLNASGFLMELPAGDLAMAMGIEYRKEKGQDTPDSIIGSSPRINSYRTTSSSPRLGTTGEYDLKEAYVEFNVPLLDGEPMAEYLELNLATRFSDYSTFGSTTNSKAGILYTPTEGLSFRATWAEGFRAPSILELFEGQRVTFKAVTDPCVADNTLPGCAGVPGDYTQPDSNVQITTGGNRLLQPETSENTSYGLIYMPTFLENFSVTLDWYNIDINNTISEFGAQNILDLCAYKNKNCDVITRNSLGEIDNIIDGPVNLNSTTVAGMDMVIRYGIDDNSGQWDFMANFSKLDELTEVSTLSDGSTQKEDKVGTAASRESFPEWRSSISANWKRDDYFASYSARYIGGTTETVSNEDRDISSIVYHNISAGYHFDNGLKVKLGVNNIADKQPPASLTNKNINFDQNTYNPVGRYFYVQMDYTL